MTHSALTGAGLYRDEIGCGWRDCPEITPGRDRYCPDHRPIRVRGALAAWTCPDGSMIAQDTYSPTYLVRIDGRPERHFYTTSEALDYMDRTCHPIIRES